MAIGKRGKGAIITAVLGLVLSAAVAQDENSPRPAQHLADRRGAPYPTRSAIPPQRQGPDRPPVDLADDDTLRDEIILVDPVALTKPWTVTKTFKRAPPKFKRMPYVCENNRDG